VGAALRCPRCEETFPFEGQVPVLLGPKDATRLAAFSARYGRERVDEGWQALAPGPARALPYGRPPGYPALYWPVRRQSYAALVRQLRRVVSPHEAGPAVDLGAGSGWLAYRLAQAGYRVLALDASLDEAWGLGAGALYERDFPRRLLRVQGDLEHPPFQAGVLGVVLFNASLHYSADLGSTLGRAAGALRPRGWLVILDTPVARQPRLGTGRGDRHLGRTELDQALRDAGLRPRWVRVRRGPAWWAYQARKLLKGEALFSFPLVMAERQQE
jgi:SAM-dependent methyltransferase